MTYKRPHFGKQTVQTYHPERGPQWAIQVSTYGANGWLISFCSYSEIDQIKRRDKERVFTKCNTPY